MHVKVSIHAPARGATRWFFDNRVYYYVSIHAPARGATRGESSSSIPAWFQSTPLREGRPVKAEPYIEKFEFQSTPLREGRRSALASVESVLLVSIHAPARGATT